LANFINSKMPICHMASETRKFDGKAYQLYFITPTRKVLDNVREYLKQIGKNVRVISNGYTFFVYSR